MKNLTAGTQIEILTKTGLFTLKIKGLEYDFMFNEVFVIYDRVNNTTGETKKDVISGLDSLLNLIKKAL